MHRVWIDLCDYLTVPFSRENFASCLDRFVRLFDCSVLKGELYFVFGSTCAIIELFRSQGRTVLRVCIGFCLIIIDNHLVLGGEHCLVFALDFV